jgi:hypothetical protein
MTLVIPRFIKKILKSVVKVVASIIAWVLLFIYYRIKVSKGKHLPGFIASQCFGKNLVHTVDPNIIKYHIINPDNMPGNLFIWSGEWDKDIMSIEQHEKFVMMKELFMDNKPIQDTQFYSYATALMNKKKPLNRGSLILDSTDNIRTYFKKNEKLFKDIKSGGFDLDIAPEIGVAISRDGKLIHFRQGHHTYAIARFLGETNVKVRIRAVHDDWLAKLIMDKKLLKISSITSGFNELFN